jgi:Transposase DDE domain
MERILDLYTDYLQVTFRGASATGLSEVLDGCYTHDKITRLLSGSDFGSKELWQSVKPLVRAHQQSDACLIFDDSIIEKPYTDESELVSWHYDHSKGRSVKGIGLLTAFYHTESEHHSQPLRIPVGYELIRKPIEYCELKTKKQKRMSTVTKNELLRQMVLRCIRNDLLFRFVLADSWFASTENMHFIHEKGKTFIFDLKTNRLAAKSEADRKEGRWTAISEMDLPEMTPVQVWLKDLDIPVLVVKQTFKNEGGSEGLRYLVTNDLNLSAAEITTTYKKRWGVEEYHKSIKQNTAVAKSPTKTIRTQSNHIFASLLAYVKFEKLKFADKTNHFALKSKLYLTAVKAAFKELSSWKQPMAADCVM